jgi:hypothetical protein
MQLAYRGIMAEAVSLEAAFRGLGSARLQRAIDFSAKIGGRRGAGGIDRAHLAGLGTAADPGLRRLLRGGDEVRKKGRGGGPACERALVRMGGRGRNERPARGRSARPSHQLGIAGGVEGGIAARIEARFLAGFLARLLARFLATSRPGAFAGRACYPDTSYRGHSSLPVPDSNVSGCCRKKIASGVPVPRVAKPVREFPNDLRFSR